MEFLYTFLEYIYTIFKTSLKNYIVQQGQITFIGALIKPGKYIAVNICGELLKLLEGDFATFVVSNQTQISTLFFRIFTNLEKERLLGLIPETVFTEHRSSFAKLILLFQNYLGRSNIKEMIEKYEKDTWVEHYAYQKRTITFNDDITKKFDFIIDLFLPILETLRTEEEERIFLQCNKEAVIDILSLKGKIHAALEKDNKHNKDNNLIDNLAYLKYLRAQELEHARTEVPEGENFQEIESPEAQARIQVKDISSPKKSKSTKSRSASSKEAKRTKSQSSRSSLKNATPVPFLSHEIIQRKNKVYEEFLEVCRGDKTKISKMYFIYTGIITILTNLKDWTDHRKYYIFCFLFYCFKTKYKLTNQLEVSGPIAIGINSRLRKTKSRGGKNGKTRKYHKK